MIFFASATDIPGSVVSVASVAVLMSTRACGAKAEQSNGEAGAAEAVSAGVAAGAGADGPEAVAAGGGGGAAETLTVLPPMERTPAAMSRGRMAAAGILRSDVI